MIIKEDAPVNSVGAGQVAGIGVGPKGEPGRGGPLLRRRKPDFAKAAVFEVDSNTFHECKMQKRKYAHWKKYLGEDDALTEIKEYAKANPNKPIIIQNKLTQEMCYVRYRK